MRHAAGRRSPATLPEFHANLQCEGPHDRLVAHRLTHELLSPPKPPTAIFTASDTQALGVLEAAGFEGFTVPEALSVAGFDDLEVAANVGLTTVHQPLEEWPARHRTTGRRPVRRRRSAA